MRRLLPYALPLLLVLCGGFLLIVGIAQGQDLRVLAGAALALMAGVVSMLLLRGAIGNRSGLILGIVFAAMALGLAYLNYRSLHNVGARMNNAASGTKVRTTACHSMRSPLQA